MFFFGAAVRVRAGRTSDRGNPDNTVLDWSPGAVQRATLTGLNIQPNGAPGAASENEDADRDLVVTSWRVQSAPGTDLDVTAWDRIEWDGMLLAVDGEVARWSNPLTGGTHHVEFVVKRATG